jgi:hypothetical protein
LISSVSSVVEVVEVGFEVLSVAVGSGLFVSIGFRSPVKFPFAVSRPALLESGDARAVSGKVSGKEPVAGFVDLGGQFVGSQVGVSLDEFPAESLDLGCGLSVQLLRILGSVG